MLENVAIILLYLHLLFVRKNKREKFHPRVRPHTYFNSLNQQKARKIKNIRTSLLRLVDTL